MLFANLSHFIPPGVAYLYYKPGDKNSLIQLSSFWGAAQNYSPMSCAGTALYNWRESVRLKIYSIENKVNFSTKKIDDSIYDALNIAFKSKKRVITGSFSLQAPCDYKNGYLLPKDYLEFLAKGLEENDQIMIFSAGNFGNHAHFLDSFNIGNITDTIKKSEETYKILKDFEENGNYNGFEEKHFKKIMGISNIEELATMCSQQNFFLQYATHPIIKKRFLIVTNVALSVEYILKNSKAKVKFSNDKEYEIGLHYTSSYPGDDTDLQNMTVSTFGNNIMAANEYGFSNENGTSVAVPVVAGLLILIDEYHLKKNEKLSGPELLKILKETCILPDEKMEKYYGNGIIDPLGFLNLKENKE